MGFWATWVAVVFLPARFFGRPPSERSRWHPLAFAIVVGVSAGFLGAIALALIERTSPGTAVAAALATSLLSAVTTLWSVCFTAALAHFWLWLLRGRHAPIRDTFDCVCYAQATALFSVIGVIGSIIAAVWQLVVLSIGLKHTQRTTIARAAFATLAGPTSLILLALVLRTLVVEAFKVPAASMHPTIHAGDHLFVNKLAYGPLIPGTHARIFSSLPPRYGDVMVFELPDSNERQDFVKRVVALPGDTLVVEDGHPIVNGWRVPSCRVGILEFNDGEESVSGECHVEFLGDRSYLTFYDEKHATGRQGPYQVAPGEVWVLGDNRHNSADSRSWFAGRGGGVPFQNIKGRVSLVWLSYVADESVAWDRLFLDVMGTPRLSEGASPELHAALKKCLAERPPIAQTTPKGSFHPP